MHRLFHRARATALALVAALALTGLPATAALAEDAPSSATISGRVELPADVVSASISAFWDDPVMGWSQGAWTDVAADGVFALQGLQPGRAYAIEVRSDAGQIVTGFYAGPDAFPTPSRDAAVSVVAPADGVVIVAQEAATISGVLALPDAGDRSTEPMYAIARPLDGSPWGTQDPVSEDGAFVVRGLAPGGSYRLELTDGLGVLGGWFVGDGEPLSRDHSSFAPVVAPATGLHITPGIWASVSGVVDLPDGFVVGDGAPLTVSAYRHDTVMDYRYLVTESVVAADGSFTLEHLIPGDPYALRLTDPTGVLPEGWMTTNGITTSETESVDVVAPAAGVVVRPRTGGVEVPVVGATITGSVILPSDVGQSWVNVTAYRWVGYWAYAAYTSVTAQGSGSTPFTLSGLEPGATYRVQVQNSGMLIDGTWAGDGQPLVREMTDGQDVLAGRSGLELRLRAGATVEGMVHAPAGLVIPAMAGVRVSAMYLATSPYGYPYWATSRSSWITMMNDEDQIPFAIGGLEPGENYRIEVQDNSGTYLGGYFAGTGPLATTADGGSDVTAPVNDLHLQLRPAVSISGTVVLPDGYTPQYLSVTASETSNGGVWTGLRSASVDPTTHRFVIGGLDPGAAYTVQLSETAMDGSGDLLGGYYSSDAAFLTDSVNDAVSIVGGRSGITLKAERGATVTGHLALPSGYEAPSGPWVYAFSGNGGAFGTRVEADGSFVVRRVRPGAEVRLQFSDGDGGFLDGLYAGEGKPLAWSGAGVPVLGGTTGLQAVAQASSTLLGTVSRPAGHERDPWGIDAVVGVYDAASGERVRTGWNVPTEAEERSDADVRTQEVPPGTFKIGFNRESGTSLYTGTFYTAEPRDTPVRFADADVVRVATGEVVENVDAHLSTCASVSGEVDPALLPADQDGQVVIYNDDDPDLVTRSAWTRDGAFAVTGLLQGQYHVALGYFGDDGYVEVTEQDLQITECDEVSGVELSATPPVQNVGAPTVSGVAQVGRTLTASAGTWSPADATVSFQWLRDGAVVPGAVGASYVLTAADLGAELSVQVTASADGRGAGVVTSVATQPVVPATFTRTASPAISGTAKVGSTLTASAGTWTPSGSTPAYQWLRSGTAIEGATGSTYAVAVADLGTTVSVEVTVSKPGYAPATARSAATAAVVAGTIVSTTKPTVTGTAKVGSTLTTSAGGWTPAGTTPDYQWLRGGVAISGATAATYTVAAADLGDTLAVKVTPSLTGYTGASATSAPTAPVVAGTFTASAAPAITGTAKVGSVLTASAGTWSPTGTSVTYQWLRAGAVISGATSASYTATAADLGKALSVKVTVARTGYAGASATSAPTAQVVAGTFTTTTAPAITGTAKVGSVLTASAGTWSPTATSMTYQWLRAGSAISGATTASYAPTAADVGKALSVKVTVARTGYTGASATSAPTAQVVAGTISTTVAPAITGTAKVGSLLTASAGTWSPAATTVTYQWLRAGEAISGATTVTYRPTAADLGAALSVKVTVARTGYTGASATSAATAKVVAGTFAMSAAPRITGAATVGSVLAASRGLWTPAGTGTTVTFQWKRAGVAIGGATGRTYVLTPADKGKAVSVTVTVSRDGYTPGSATPAGVAVS
ncbi:hypothetical protein [Cellulomonas sp. P5_C5]